MVQDVTIGSIVENTRQEILFAVKERINAITRGTSAPVQLNAMIREKNGSGRNSLFFYEITNVYIDDDDRLCGDLAGKDDRFSGEVLFGKDIEDLPVSDLKLILDLLYGDNWNVDVEGYDMNAAGRREGLYGFLMSGKAGISRILRRGA